MSDETDEKPAEATENTATPTSKGQRWSVWRWLVRKPFAGIVAVILVGLTATFSSGLQTLFTGLLPDGWDEPGSGIKVVDVRRQATSGRVLIPHDGSGARFSDLNDALDSVNDPKWEAEHEWYAAGNITWEVTLVGRHGDPVVITDLRPERIGPCTKRVETGTIVEDLPAGEGEKVELETAIDAAVPRLTSVEDGSAYFDDGTVTLAKGETVIISITATSAGPTCRWVLAADYVDNGKRESMSITAPGDRPFAITGYADRRPYEHTWNTRCDRALKPAEVAVTQEPADCR
jgi:hypothetical protein